MSPDESVWVCRNCGNRFTPEKSHYDCPKCHSTTTFPDKNNKTMRRIEEDRISMKSPRPAETKEEKSTSNKVLIHLFPLAESRSFEEKLCLHLQSIGVKANIIQPGINSNHKSEKGVLSQVRSFIDTLPTAAGKVIASTNIEDRNIEGVEVFELLKMVSSKKGNTKRKIVYFYCYVVDCLLSGLEKELEAETSLIKEGGFFSKRTVGFKWVPTQKGKVEGILVKRLNEDNELNNELFRLNLCSAIQILLREKDKKIEISYGVGENMMNFPSREAFDLFDKIAGHVKSVSGSPNQLSA